MKKIRKHKAAAALPAKGAAAVAAGGQGDISAARWLDPASPEGRVRVGRSVAWGVALLVLLVFLSSLKNGFVNWDDDLYVYGNSFIRSLKPSFFAWAFTDLSAGFWHPLTWISYALDYAVWGDHPAGYHLTAALLHAVNSALVVLLVLRVLDLRLSGGSPSWLKPLPAGWGRLIAAGVTGLLFGLHPLHVESVAWVSERKDLLCALFFLLSLLAYLEYAGAEGKGRATQEGDGFSDRSASPDSADSADSASVHSASVHSVPFWRHPAYLLSFGMFLCALASKSMAVSLPVVLLILDRHVAGRVGSLKGLMRALPDKVPFLAGSLALSLISIGAQKSIGAMTMMESTTLSQRLLVAARSLWAYLVQMLFPVDLLPFYPFPKGLSLISPTYAASVALFLALCLLGFRKKAQQSVWLPAWLYYLVTLLPVLGIVKVGNFAMADRFTYLPSLGPFLLVGLGAAWGWGRWGAGAAGKLLGAAGLTLFALLALLTLKQVAIWKSSIDLWNYFLAREPRGNVTAYLNRGVAHGDRREFDLAIRDFSTALVMDPRNADALLNRGMAQVARGDFESALRDYEAALAIKPDFADAYTNRGSVFLRRKELDRALADYDRAIALAPKLSAAYLNRALVFKGKGELERAIADYDTALKLQPDSATAYLARGDLQMQRGAIEKAVADYQAACKLGNQAGCSKAVMPFVVK